MMVPISNFTSLYKHVVTTYSFCILALAVLCGCQPRPVLGLQSESSLLDTEEFKDIILHAVDCLEQLENKFAKCPEPAFAIHKLDSNFKYGRFCGKGYPFKTPDNLSRAEIKQYVKKYYSIKPIDDIDRACREHDVCWTINGGPKAECNDILKYRLRTLNDQFIDQVGWFNLNNWQWRCASLATDISTTVMIFEGKYDDNDENTADNISKIVVSPIALMSVGVFCGRNLEDAYPHHDEKCSININQ